jgi:hypothetical protein
MAQAKSDPTPIDDTASKAASSDWLSIVDDIFPRCNRLGSSETAKAKLRALFDDPETRLRIRRVDASGKEVSDTRRSVGVEFCQRYLSVVSDPDRGDDQMAVDYGEPSADYYTPGGRWVLEVRRRDVERWERLHPELAAPPSTAAPAVSEVATQDVSREAQGVDPFHTGGGGRPTAMEFVLLEAERRIRDGEVELRRGLQQAFAEQLVTWWEKERKTHTPHGPKVTAKTIRNNLDFRNLWNQALDAKSQNPPPENPKT